MHKQLSARGIPPRVAPATATATGHRLRPPSLPRCRPPTLPPSASSLFRPTDPPDAAPAWFLRSSFLHHRRAAPPPTRPSLLHPVVVHPRPTEAPFRGRQKPPPWLEFRREFLHCIGLGLAAGQSSPGLGRLPELFPAPSFPHRATTADTPFFSGVPPEKTTLPPRCRPPRSRRPPFPCCDRRDHCRLLPLLFCHRQEQFAAGREGPSFAGRHAHPRVWFEPSSSRLVLADRRRLRTLSIFNLELNI